MADTQPMQAPGKDGHKGEPDGVGEESPAGGKGKGQSGGGAYPNPHTDGDDKTP